LKEKDLLKYIHYRKDTFICHILNMCVSISASNPTRETEKGIEKYISLTKK
tara:strand:+ start:250 stop:402 length:153 start_codon:yes stop_codon:yes gene_type:complete